jgi:hypothetical protein
MFLQKKSGGIKETQLLLTDVDCLSPRSDHKILYSSVASHKRKIFRFLWASKGGHSNTPLSNALGRVYTSFTSADRH